MGQKTKEIVRERKGRKRVGETKTFKLSGKRADRY